MSSLQCPVTMLVVPAPVVAALDLTGLPVAHVWADPASSAQAEARAARLGVGVTTRDVVAGREVLGEIADAHPGETVLVVSSDVVDPAVVLADSDGWSRRPWTGAGAEPGS